MFKRIGLTVVACGLMLGVAGFADAGTVPVKNTNRSTVVRTTVKPHRMTFRKGVHRTTNHRHHFGVKGTKVSLSNAVARRGFHGQHHHHHHNWNRMV